MERGGPALELKLWAAQEMGLPPQVSSRVPLSLCIPRMCSGQCAEIWRYVTRHVHHQSHTHVREGVWVGHISMGWSFWGPSPVQLSPLAQGGGSVLRE
uniref:Uncharacterized protein n=1 Tax=Terrapene triunguis TaxID=2587831 RepID=A0A674J553_9SAUR